MNLKNCMTALSIAAVVSITGSATTPASAAEDNAGSDKVFVCKYVGQPGVDEVLQTGNNPIEVSVNAIPGSDGLSAAALLGFEFADGQGRSVVIAESLTRGDGQRDEPTIADCPAPIAPPVEEPVVPPVEEPVVPPVGEPVVPPVDAPVEEAPINGDIEVLGAQATADTGVKAQPNANSNAGTQVMGQQAQAAPTSVLGQQARTASVPTSVNAGLTSDAGNAIVLPASLALMGALLSLVAFAARRRA